MENVTPQEWLAAVIFFVMVLAAIAGLMDWNRDQTEASLQKQIRELEELVRNP